MKCMHCGKALGNEKAVCPFCGAFLEKEQIQEFLQSKKEREKDLRPRLVSEQYGMAPILYEQKRKKDDAWMFGVLFISVVLVVIFLIAVFILF